MSDIRIDFDRLDRARTRLTTVIGDFDATGDVQAQLPAATGHLRLAGVVGDFRSAWSVRRGQLTEELKFINDSITAIHDTFQELDKDLAIRAEAYTTEAD